MKTISLSVYNRPGALRRMLESLKRNNTEGWELIASIDDDGDLCFDCATMLARVDWMSVRFLASDHHLGLALNTFLAPSLAFAAGSDFNLYLEDDLLLSPDALDLCNWYQRQAIYNVPNEVGVVLWRSSIHSTVDSDSVSRYGQGGHGNGFACTRHQWESFWRKEWFGYGNEGPGKMWDINTDNRLRELGLHVLSPLYPRSVQQRVDGTHGKSTDDNPLTSVKIYQGPAVKEFRIV